MNFAVIVHTNWAQKEPPRMCAASIIALMMEAARTSETLVKFYQTTRRYNPERSHLHSRRRENLKSYLRVYHSSCKTFLCHQ
jgi:hypothetical protein